MKNLKIASVAILLAIASVFIVRLTERHITESNQNKKVSEICEIVTSEVQTGSQNKALESAKTLFISSFPQVLQFVQIMEHGATYGIAPSDNEVTHYRLVTCDIAARSDASMLFYVYREELVGPSFVLSVIAFIMLFFFLIWIAKKIIFAAQRKFNQELQKTLGFSSDLPTSGPLGQFLETIVLGVGSGKNLKESIQNLKEKIIEQNRETLALRETQLATELELKKNEKFIEVVRQVRHDIRSPLQTLTVLTDKNIDLATSHRQMNAVISSIHEMIEDLEIKEEMADPSRAEERLHIAEALIKEVVQQKRLVFDTTQIELKINSDFLNVVRINPHHFRRVIGNILQNAYEAITIAGVFGKILIETSRANDRIFIKIQDNGKGIPEEIQKQLFVPGFTYGKNNGSGLGLSHAKSCILRWGGDINIESVQGQGITVSVSLPVAIPNAQFIPQPLSSDAKVHVVLDDDALDFERLQRTLSTPAVYCANISDFEEWWSALQNQDDAQFIFDYNLGDNVSGLEVLKFITSKHPKILYTNDYDRLDVIEASQMGIYVLPKVFLH